MLEDLGLRTVATLLLLIVILAPLLRAFIQRSRSPLNGVPGSLLSRYTGFTTFYHGAFCQDQAQYIQSLHRKYGPIVRIGPQEVAVSSFESFKMIHKIGSGFKKSAWFDFVGLTEKDSGPASLFNMTDPGTHAAMRKLLAKGFSASNMRRVWEPAVRKQVHQAIEQIGNDATDSDGVVDMQRWWMLMVGDVVSETSFGTALGGLDFGEEPAFPAGIRRANVVQLLAYNAPLLYEIAKRLPIPTWRPYFKALEKLRIHASMAVENSRADATTQNIFTEVLASAEKEDNPLLTDLQITVEAGGLIAAGGDTVGITLTYIVWAVLSKPRLQAALEEEVSGVEADLHDGELEKLPILNAVIQETLRAYPAAPFPQPRVVPQGGITLEGYYLPEDTVVLTSPWMLQHDASIFPDPDRFDHTRWLPNGPAANSETARTACWAFGAGSRVCIGRHLAMMELRMATALFFRQHKGAKLAPETTPESMVMKNLVLSSPAAGMCKIILFRH